MAVTALAVATKEATAKDSNAVYLQSVKVIAVAIRKARKLANGYRLAAVKAGARAVSKRDLSSPLGNRVFPALVPPCGEV